MPIKGLTELTFEEIKKGKEIGFVGHAASRKFVWRICAICGEAQWRRIDSLRQVCGSCSIKANSRKWRATHNNQRGAENPRWKGGRIIRNGYIEIRLNPDDPFFSMAKSNGYIAEHRLIVAKRLGRCLKPWEQIHHLDGNKQNNSDLNLVLATSHPLGYAEGYKQGIKDGMEVRAKELMQEVRLVKLQLKSLRKEIQITMFKEDRL